MHRRAAALLYSLPELPMSCHLLMDCAYEGNEPRQLALDLGFIPVVSPHTRRVEPWRLKKAVYRRRNEIERLFRRLKGFRRIFSRFDKLVRLHLLRARHRGTTWGWSDSPPYIKARNQLNTPGTHETLNGKVPTRSEANRMIEEAGGTVVRNDPGHPPGGVSGHEQPHVNYYTAGGKKATVIVRED